MDPRLLGDNWSSMDYRNLKIYRILIPIIFFLLSFRKTNIESINFFIIFFIKNFHTKHENMIWDSILD